MTRLQNFSEKIAPSWSTLKRIGISVNELLFLSPEDDRISFKKALCLTINNGEISVAAGSRLFSRIKINGFKNYPSPEAGFPPPNFLASSLELAVAELGVEKYPITLSIPKAWAVIKTVIYPSTVLENLSAVISYELDKITPFTPEYAYYDFKILKKEGEELTLLVAAARADLIDPYLKVIREKEFKVDRITINLLGMGSLCRYNPKSNHGFFIEIDKSHYEGVLSLSDSSLEVLSGSFVERNEKSKVEQINTEIESLMPLSGPNDLRGEAVFYLRDKSPTLKEAIKLQTRHAFTFLDESDLGFGPLGKERKQIPYTAVGGILESLWTKSWGLNLFIKGFHQKSKPPWVITLLLLLILGVLVGIYWTTPIDIEKKRLGNLEKQIVLKKREVKKVEDLKKEIEWVSGEIARINDFKQSKPLGLNILKELTVVLPNNAWLTRVRIFESQVNIEGYAPSATLLIPKLEGTKIFKKVEFTSPTFKDPRQNMDRFQIKMELKSP